MKKAILLGVAALLLAFWLVRWMKLEAPIQDQQATPESLDSQARDRVTRFWSSFQEATRLRTGGDCAAASKAYRSALELDPTHQESLYYLGNCLFELGEYSEARRTYQRLLELEPNSPRGLSGLGILLSSPFPGNQMDVKKAREAFQQVSRINPEHSGPFLRLGMLALQQDHLEEALRNFKTAAGFRSPEGIFLTGLVLYRLGRLPEAQQEFQRVLEIETQEEAISKRGASSEGDKRVVSETVPLSPLQAAALQSRVFLTWIRLARGEAGVPDSLAPRIPLRKTQSRRIETLALLDRDRDRVRAWRAFGGLPRLEKAVSRDRILDLPPGIEYSGTVLSAVHADYDGDGRQDLFLVRWKASGILWRNRGGNVYEDVTRQAGLEGLGADYSGALFFDYDGDGQPDLLLAKEAEYVRALQYLIDPALELEQGTPRLFRNQRGHFSEVTAEANLNHPYSVQQAFAADFNRDSRMDLVLINGGISPEVLLPSTVLLNRGGKFQEFAWIPDLFVSAPVAGAALEDFDQDGRLELFLEGIGLFRILAAGPDS